ncbi:MAG: hypothetical protein Q8R96_11620 [Bacteroidota bacterium]|nr:hypothetical protein [Bacteroidota bacterium]
MKTCKTCGFFIRYENTAVGDCAMFGDKNSIANNSAVFDQVQENGIPMCDVGENFGCIHWTADTSE